MYNNKNHFIIWIILILFVGPIYTIDNASLINASTVETEIKVVTSTSLIEDFVSQIAGDYVSVDGILVEGNEDPHTYEPVPSDITALIEADIFFLMGREGLEPWWSTWESSILEDNPDLRVIAIMNESMIELDNMTGENNPHGWMSPIIAKDMVRNIYLELSSVLDASVSDELATNYGTYLGKLDQLIDEIQSNRTEFAGTKVVVHHPAFKYLYDLLGIDRVAIIEEQHDVEPSAQHIQEIKEIMEEHNITLLIHQANLDEDEIMQIARDTGGKIVWGAPLMGMTGINGEILDSYEKLIRYNIWALKNPTIPEDQSSISGFDFMWISIVGVISLAIIIKKKKHK